MYSKYLWCSFSSLITDQWMDIACSQLSSALDDVTRRMPSDIWGMSSFFCCSAAGLTLFRQSTSLCLHASVGLHWSSVNGWWQTSVNRGVVGIKVLSAIRDSFIMWWNSVLSGRELFCTCFSHWYSSITVFISLFPSWGRWHPADPQWFV